MMETNVLLLGNGFDLNHNFPTAYIDFLHTMCFLVENYHPEMKTVGNVFGNEELSGRCKNIRESYEQHQKIYNQTLLNRFDIENLIAKARGNLWFNYFSQTLERDIGWIDFEKEIKNVVEAFQCFFDHIGESTAILKAEQQVYIVNQFSFFSKTSREDFVDTYFWNIDEIKEEYLKEYPIGSELYELDQERIIEELFYALMKFADMLRAYLSCFIEAPLEEMREYSYCAENKSYPQNVDYVFTFNYTNTYERLYEQASLTHIHGDVLNNIILGINPDENDELPHLSTSFIKFKKYFQRIMSGTDAELRMIYSHIDAIQKYDNGMTLYAVGHSLDVTDEDIIKQLFSFSNRVIILYHSKEAMASMVKNLVSIYGKKEYDTLALEKNIQFLPLSKTTWSSKKIQPIFR